MPHAIDINVGKRIRERRWLIDISQQQLGDQVGVKFQQIQKYETGTNRVSASRLFDIAAALGVPVSYFFDGIDGQADAVEIDKDTAEIVRIYSNLGTPQKSGLMRVARALALPVVPGMDGAVK